MKPLKGALRFFPVMLLVTACGEPSPRIQTSREFEGCITSEKYTPPYAVIGTGRGVPAKYEMTVKVDQLGIKTITPDGKAEDENKNYDPGDKVKIQLEVAALEGKDPDKTRLFLDGRMEKLMEGKSWTVHKNSEGSITVSKTGSCNPERSL